MIFVLCNNYKSWKSKWVSYSLEELIIPCFGCLATRQKRKQRWESFLMLRAPANYMVIGAKVLALHKWRWGKQIKKSNVNKWLIEHFIFQISLDGKVTSSDLQIAPKYYDNGKNLICRAENQS